MAKMPPPPIRPVTPAGHTEIEDGPLWSTIKSQLYRSEVAHVKRLVGEALIQRNRLMWDELNSLKQILMDFQQQNDELEEGMKQQVLFCGSQHRDLLRRQAQMILDDLKTQAEATGHDLEDVLPDLKKPEMQDFVRGVKDVQRGFGKGMGKLEGFTPPATPSTRPPSSSGYRPPSASSGARPASSGGRSGCSTPDPVLGCLPLPLGRALHLDDLALVAKGIREALESEHESLLSAIGEQMEHLEAEADHRKHTVKASEPSTAQLQQFVHKLQELAASPALKTLSITGVESALPASPSLGGSSVRRLQALIAQRRQASPRRSSTSSLGAVPEGHDGISPSHADKTAPTSIAGGGYSAGATKGMPFDPFFDDPLFAAAVETGVGCLAAKEVGVLS